MTRIHPETFLQIVGFSAFGLFWFAAGIMAAIGLDYFVNG